MIVQRNSDCLKAIPLIEDSGDLLDQYPDALLSYSECKYQAGDLSHAKNALASFDKLQAGTLQQYRQAAALYARLGLSNKAQEERSKAQSRDDPTADSVLKRTAVLERENRLEEAQKALQAEAIQRPTFDVLFELAEVASRRGEVAVALKTLKRASEIEPGREESYLEFSTICADHGNDQLALDSAEIGLEHAPNSYRLTVQKGAVQEKLGHLNDAEQTLKKAIGMQKDNSVALASLAVVQAHSGRQNEAEETLSNAIRQFPDDYYMHYFRGKLLLQLGNAKIDGDDRREVAKRSLERAIELNPTYADAYYQLSSVYTDSSPKLAEQALQKCLQLDPTHIPAQYALARLFVRTGRKAQGEALFARLKGQQRAEELKQQKQLRIEVAQN
jgi:tetratricopeptide (TPR) repeat protein